ncbi:hypothetical protein [Coleofasciculus sp. FACHB-T130]|uniref:hypothetical protein n=1 Tax=Coleofasciculus sp. FACHB-T130 TaxID=2692792 RepID=UPI001A7F0DC2|nr:hypothetical protein [Coleofasciculus sp. FACHB-T130]
MVFVTTLDNGSVKRAIASPFVKNRAILLWRRYAIAPFCSRFICDFLIHYEVSNQTKAS